MDKHPIKVIICVDEAHELSPFPLEKRNKPMKRSRFDILCSRMSIFVGQPMMVLFMSTVSSLIQLAPPREFARSFRAINDRTIDHAPITELPFDCHPDFPLKPTNYTLAKLSELEFLAKFGRPLYVG